MRLRGEDGGAAAPVPVQHMVLGALHACTPEVRRDLASQGEAAAEEGGGRRRGASTAAPPFPRPPPSPATVVLCGGGSLLRGLPQRLHWELQAHIPQARAGG